MSSRRPVPSGGPTESCTCNPPRSGTTNGAANVNSSTTAHPTSSAARNANSTNAAPGTTTTPDTA
ncbi:hypothetical protein Saso_77290 [Streptomyces asoensis]|uniref:Uncharacterized protein n=1 Tax=Streptomyces asoensis TaxID=249586 RepID=A0ABQ3SD64_9ACTN|nr:hypothetical protein Saso_77290 [Streptomyces asoensis]